MTPASPPPSPCGLQTVGDGTGVKPIYEVQMEYKGLPYLTANADSLLQVRFRGQRLRHAMVHACAACSSHLRACKLPHVHIHNHARTQAHRSLPFLLLPHLQHIAAKECCGRPPVALQRIEKVGCWLGWHLCARSRGVPV